MAAYSRWKTGVIVIDLGTATTFDVVTNKGDFIGGIIAPGIGILNEALKEKCALLPSVAIRKPKKIVGRNTKEAMQSGIFNGYISLVDGLVQRIQEETGLRLKVVATGGWASKIAAASQTIETVAPYLTLEGLRELYEKST